MTIEEKVAQLRGYRSADFLVDGQVSAAMMQQLLGQGLGFVASLAGDKPPAETAAIVNQVQRYQVENTARYPPAILNQEALHGVTSRGSTMFPQAIALASSFDPAFLGRVATALGREVRALGHTLALSAVLDLGRDPRCGRTEETYGEGRKVEFTLTRKELSYLGWNLTPVFEPGAFELMLGASSADIRLRTVVTV